MFCRVGLILALLVMSGCSGCPSSSRGWKDGVCRDCNVVLVTIDALRPDHLGIHGYKRPTSPIIDGYFADKSVFQNATSAATCTVISVKQILTGDFDAKGPRFAEVLKQRGYQTAGVVSQHIFKWWGRMKDFSVGFDTWKIQGPKELDQHGMSRRGARRVSTLALEWLNGLDQKRPFFLWLHYFDPHDPYEPPEQFRKWKTPGATHKHGDRRTVLRKLAKKGMWHEAGKALSDEDTQHFIDLYDGEIRYADHQLGRVLKRIEEMGLSDKTIVVLTSDHGEHLGEDGLWDHCYSLRENETRVPLMINVPRSVFPEHNLERAATSTLDLFPTVMGLLDVPIETEGLEGKDLRAQGDRLAVALFKEAVAVKQNEWKLYITRQDGKWSPTGLYNVADDPLEHDNRAEHEPARATELHEKAQSFFRHVDERTEFDAKTLQELRAIGYTE